MYPKTRLRVMLVETTGEHHGELLPSLFADPSVEVVYLASSGEEALEALGQAAPDLMLVDLGLPGIDGFETADRAREQRPDLDVVVMAACKPEVTRKDACGNLVEVMRRSDIVSSHFRRISERRRP